MRNYRPETFGDLMAETYDARHPVPEAETRDAVERLAQLAPGPSLLELAIGTGRLALPLTERGFSVHGIDASEAIVAKLREKPGGMEIPVTPGDMATTRVPGEFDLVYLVYNTIFNLTSAEAQVQCFQNAAHHIKPDGLFVLETLIPSFLIDNASRGIRTHRLSIDAVVLEAASHDPVLQTIEYQYLELSAQGIQLYPVPWRYAWPSELDLMARLAGLVLRDRWSGWNLEPFSASSEAHVSVYSRSEDGPIRSSASSGSA